MSLRAHCTVDVHVHCKNENKTEQILACIDVLLKEEGRERREGREGGRGGAAVPLHHWREFHQFDIDILLFCPV